MSIPSFEKLFTKDCGVSNIVRCPVCQKNVFHRLFENTDTGLPAVFLKKEPVSYFAVCPECASVFSVNKNFMTELLAGTSCIMTESDLDIIVKGGKKDE
ncbi:MAG: hypothetical protein IJ262_09825 [Clostridia bacterium]|nr:hypothetical protein [Clostridia bacterium]